MRFRLGLNLLVIVFCVLSCFVPAFAVDGNLDLSVEDPVRVGDEILPAASLFSADIVVDDSTLKHVPFIGSGYFVGSDRSLGTVYVYVPISSKGSWGVTPDGYLCNIGGSSVSGYLFTEAGTQYIFNCPAMSVPRYRLGSGYDYTNCYLTVSDSNLDPADEFAPSVTFEDSQLLIVIGLMGVIVLCLMRYRH